MSHDPIKCSFLMPKAECPPSFHKLPGKPIMGSEQHVAIVTGGNSGMGMAISRRLVEKGWKVAIADIRENKTFAQELDGASSFHQCNVADYSRCAGPR